MGTKNDISGGYDLMEIKITIHVQENGQIKIEYPNDLSLMENVGILEASKAILLKEYLNPKISLNDGFGIPTPYKAV